jgi:hypothetical protein
LSFVIAFSVATRLRLGTSAFDILCACPRLYELRERASSRGAAVARSHL